MLDLEALEDELQGLPAEGRVQQDPRKTLPRWDPRPTHQAVVRHQEEANVDRRTGKVSEPALETEMPQTIPQSQLLSRQQIVPELLLLPSRVQGPGNLSSLRCRQ